MTRTERLRPVVRHNDKKEQEALQEVVRFQTTLDAESSRLEELKRYKTEYLLNSQQGSRVVSAMEMQELNRFLDQLDQTIAGQERVVRHKQKELEKRQHIWKTVRIEAKAMRKAVEKLEREETVIQARNEQKELDDITQTTTRFRQRHR